MSAGPTAPAGPSVAQAAANALLEADPELPTKGLLLSVWAQVQPDAPVITSELGNRTWAELEARANQLVRALRAHGLRAGDAVALVCGNRPEFAEVMAATLRGGFRLTPVNWHLTADEAGYIIGDCEAKAVVADARHGAMVAAAVATAPSAGVLLAVGGEIDGFDDYEVALSKEDGSLIDDPSLGTSMLYTSGTTGRPKGVHRPPIPPIAGAAATSAVLGGYRAGEDAHLCTGPLYHAAPLAFSLASPLNAGVGVVLMDGWDAAETLRLVERHHITHTHMVPTMFHRLLSLPPEVRASADVSSLRFVLHGAAPCPVDVKSRLIEWLGPVVVEYYAATEGVGSFVTSEEWLARPGTVGKPATPDHVRILDEEGNEQPAGSVGLVYLKAPPTGRFQYYKDGDKTAGAFKDEHFTLGDVGYLDDDGFLFLTDRSANLIISGGVNVYPAEVEAALLSHPAVGDVAVVGVPSDEWGEAVKAVVELQPGVEASSVLAEELLEFARGRLAHFKCPRSVDFTDALPRQDNGKLYKRLLRDQYRAAAAGAPPT